MKIRNPLTKSGLERSGKQSQSGSAILIVIVLLGLMAVVMAGNNQVLRSLKKELQVIEQRQLTSYK